MARKDFDRASRSAKPPPYSIRFSWEQRDELTLLSEGQPWGQYIKDLLFVKKLRPKRSAGYRLEDKKLLGKVLGMLGASRIPNNLNQIAYQANCGSLILDEATRQKLHQCLDAILWMKRTLIKAMGIKAQDEQQPKPPPEFPTEEASNDPSW